MVMKNVEEDEKATALRRKLLSNIIVAKLKNEREKERLNVRLEGLAKQEERHLSNIQKYLVKARQELMNVKAASVDHDKYDKHGPEESLEDVYFLRDRADTNETKLSYQFPPRKAKLSGSMSKVGRKPMSFVELKRLPPLKKMDNEITINWPVPQTMNRRHPLPEFPPLRFSKPNVNTSTKEFYTRKMKHQNSRRSKQPLPSVLRSRKTDN